MPWLLVGVWLAVTGVICTALEPFLTKQLKSLWSNLLGPVDDEVLRTAFHSASSAQRVASPHLKAAEARHLLLRLRENRDPATEREARKSVESLVQMGTDKDAATLWYYAFPYSYGTQPPWCNALTQGEIAEILLNAEELLCDSRYRTWAMRALNAFFIDIKDGGVRITEAPQTWWYEEFSDTRVSPPRVLNGFLYALVSINSVWKRTHDPRAKILLDNGIRSLKEHLPEYDAKFWSYYDAKRYLASPAYHRAHVDLLTKLHSATREAILDEYRRRWEGYSPGFWRRFISNVCRGKLNNSQLAVLVAGAFMSLLIVIIAAILISFTTNTQIERLFGP